MKTQYDTWGAQHTCINYEPCPLCYGCRSYSSSWYKCRHCEEDVKNNICDTRRHTVKLLSRMIRRQKLNV